MPYSNLNITINTGLSFKPNDFVRLVFNASNTIFGRVVSYNSSTGALVLTPYDFSGTGTYTTWKVDLVGVSGTSGTSGTNGISGTAGTSGSNGTSGTNGSMGTNAVSGSSGTNGTSGSS